MVSSLLLLLLWLLLLLNHAEGGMRTEVWSFRSSRLDKAVVEMKPGCKREGWSLMYWIVRRRGGWGTEWGDPRVSCKGYNSFKKAAVCVGVGDSLKNPHTWIFFPCKSPGLTCFQITISCRREHGGLGEPGGSWCTNRKLHPWFSDCQSRHKDDVKYVSEHTVYLAPDSQAVFIEQLKLLVNLQK